MIAPPTNTVQSPFPFNITCWIKSAPVMTRMSMNTRISTMMKMVAETTPFLTDWAKRPESKPHTSHESIAASIGMKSIGLFMSARMLGLKSAVKDGFTTPGKPALNSPGKPMVIVPKELIILKNVEKLSPLIRANTWGKNMDPTTPTSKPKPMAPFMIVHLHVLPHVVAVQPTSDKLDNSS